MERRHTSGPLLALIVVVGSFSALLSGCEHSSVSLISTTSTTTSTLHHRTAPLSAGEVAKELNWRYLGFNATDKDSPLGVSIYMARNLNRVFGNFFCSEWHDNPEGETGCLGGRADCRLSASLYNSHVMVNQTTGVPLLFPMGYGLVLDQNLVESRWTKCSSIFDHASDRSYNRGCGAWAPVRDCRPDSNSAYNNVCPSTGLTCTANDTEIKSLICDVAGGPMKMPSTANPDVQCLFPGPAFSYLPQSSFTPGESKWLRTMVEERVKRSSGEQLERWNEVVLDEMLFLKDLWLDPAVAVPAFVYSRMNLPKSREVAMAMRDQFAELASVGEIPVIMIDDVEYRAGGPFIAESETGSVVVAL